ncbi:MAG TPA: hypothetical protein VIE66_00595 [Methylocella sp.]
MLRKLFATKQIGCKWRPEPMHAAEAAAVVFYAIGEPIPRPDGL